MTRRKPPAPSIEFDGRFFWYTDFYDPDEDRCSRCQELIPEASVPLVLFKDVDGQTWQARFCDDCTPAIARLLNLRKPIVKVEAAGKKDAEVHVVKDEEV